MADTSKTRQRAFYEGSLVLPNYRVKAELNAVLRSVSQAVITMANYFRLTAYHPTEDVSVIIDCNGMFEKLWQFSSFLVQKGFKVLEVGNDEKFLDVNITKAEFDSEHIILRANMAGQPINLTHTLNSKTYKAIKVEDKIYIPEKEATL